MASDKRKRQILEALKKLNGLATTRQIADTLSLNVNGVSQTLGVMENTEYVGGHGGDTLWKLKKL